MAHGLRLLLVTAMLLGTSAPLSAAPAAATAVLATGQATVTGVDGSARELRRGTAVFVGETVETGPKTYVKLKYSDGGMMLLRPATRLAIEQYQDPETGPGTAVTRLVKGGLRAVTGAIAKTNREGYAVRTPAATIGIRGTDFTSRWCERKLSPCDDLAALGVPVPEDGLYTGVDAGAIDLSNGAGVLLVPAGKYSYVQDANTQPQPLPTAPAILAVDNLPDPTADDGGDFIPSSVCQ